MTYHEKLSKILDAIQTARENFINTSTIKLYIAKANDLDDFDPNEIYDILHGIERQEKVLAIEDVPSNVAPHAGYPPPSFLGEYSSCFTIKLLDDFDNWRSKISPNEKNVYSFDKDRGILTVKGKEIPFIDEGRRIPYLDALVNSNEEDSDEYVYHSEVAEELEGANQLKDAKNTYYELCRGINARLTKNDIANFLECDYNKARINPLYKKEPKQPS